MIAGQYSPGEADFLWKSTVSEQPVTIPAALPPRSLKLGNHLTAPPPPESDPACEPSVLGGS